MPSSRMDSVGALPIPPPRDRARDGARGSGWGWADGGESEESSGLGYPPGSIPGGNARSQHEMARPVSPGARGNHSMGPSPGAPPVPLPPPGFVASGAFVMPSQAPGSGMGMGMTRSNSNSMPDRRSPSPLPVWASGGTGFIPNPMVASGMGGSRPLSPRPQYAFGGNDPAGVGLPPSRAPSGNTAAFGISRSASPRPMLNASGDGPVIPVPMPGSQHPGGMYRSNSYNSAISRPITPSGGMARSMSMNAPGGTRSGRASPQPVVPAHMHFPGGYAAADGMPPGGLNSPFSRRLSIYGGDGDGDGPGYPVRAPSPAQSSYSTGSRGRIGRARSGDEGDTPRSSRVYPRTPHYGPTSLGVGRSGAQDDAADTVGVGGGFVMLDRPMNAFTDRSRTNSGNEIKRSASRTSVASAKSTGSHKRFDSSSYVDAAFLATGSAQNEGQGSGRRKSGAGNDFDGW